MHELAFADAARPARCVVLKLLMRPYSVGHELLLLQQRNALLLSGFQTLSDVDKNRAVVQAADLCSQSWEENHFTPGTWWVKRQSRKVWARWKKAMKRGLDWKAEAAKIRQYIGDGSTFPPTEAVDGPAGRPFGAPFHAGLILFLVQQIRLPLSEAYNFPFGLAKFLYYSHAEAEGAVKIVNAPELEFEEYCRVEDAKEAAALAKTKETPCRP